MTDHRSQPPGALRFPGLRVLARPGAPTTRARARVVTAGTAVAGGLLLCALAVRRIPSMAVPTEGFPNGFSYDPRFSPLVTSAEIQVGVLIGILLLTAAALALIGQALTTGSVQRARTARVLRLVGATPGDLRRINAVELATAGAAGGVLAAPVYLLLWIALGPAAPRVLRLLPDLSSTDLIAWAAIVTGCTVVAAAAGALAAGPVRRPLLLWSVTVLVLVVAAGYTASWARYEPDRRAGIAAIGLVLLLLLLFLLAAGVGWVRLRAARLTASGSAADLLTAAGLTTAAAPVGTAAAVSLLAGTAIGVCATLLGTTVGAPAGSLFAGQLPGIALTAGAAGLAVLIALATATLGAVDDLAAHRRTLAATTALGADPDLLRRVQRRRLRIAAFGPTTAGAVVGALLGTGIISAGGAAGLPAVLTIVGVVLLTAGLAWGLTALVARSLHRRLAAASHPDNLRVA